MMNATHLQIKWFLFFVSLTLGTILKGQELIVQKIASNGVCNFIKVNIVLKNTTSTEIVNSLVKVNLPCKISYEKGSILGAIEGNITNLEIPEFVVATISPGINKTITLDVAVPCAVHSCNNAGSTFTINAFWRIGNSSISASTQAFNIASPNPLFTAISNTFYELENQSEFYRTIKIKNTRLGRLSSFSIGESFNNTKYDISFEEGQRQIISTGNIQYEFGAETISKFGDGDAFFEYDEEIVLVEKVTITACPFDIKQITSKLLLSWGCNMTACHQEVRSVIVKLRPVTESIDNLQVVPLPREPDCYFEDEALQSVNFTNSSFTSNLNEIRLELKITNAYSWIKPNSVVLDIDPSRYTVQLKDKTSVRCGEFNKSAIISIPTIKANEQINLSWVSTFCDTILCNTIGSGWTMSYQYNKDCSSVSDRFHTGNINLTNSINLGNAASEILVEKPTPITTGSKIVITHTFQSEELPINDGTFYLQYVLPCGFTVTSNDFSINGISPLAVESIINDSFNILKIKYPMPFPEGPHVMKINAVFDCNLLCIDPFCEKEFLGSCPFECTDITQKIAAVASLIIEKASNCPFPPQLKASALDAMTFKCDNQICIDSLPGWVSHNSTIFRKTLGLTDNDDNGKPDDSKLTNSPLIKRNHVMIGDTFSLLTKGLISVDLQNERARRLYAEVKIEGINMTPSNSEYTLVKEFPNLMSVNGMLPTKATSLLKSPFSSKTYKLTDLPIVFKSQSIFYINLDLDSLIKSQLLPSEYIYESGDSIFLDVEFVVTHNFKSSDYADVLPSVMDINFTTYFGFDEDIFDTQYKSTKCICQNALLKLGSIQYSLAKFGIYPTTERFLCEGDIFESRRFLSSIGVQPGFFPFEYREIYHPSKIIVLPDDNYTIQSAKIDLTDRSNANTWSKNISSWTANGNEYFFDFPIFKFDEYFKINWQYTAIVFQEMACTTTKPKSQEILKANIVLNQGELINHNIDLIHTLQKELFFSVDYPQLKFEIDKDFSESFSDSVSWEFTLTNESTKQPIIQPFLYIESNAFYSDIKVIQLTTNTEIVPLSLGVYILPDLPFGESNYLITAKIQSCDRETLELKYGWDCDIYDPLGETPCVLRETILTGFAPPPVAEIQVDPSILFAPLCTEFSYVNVSFINSGLGLLYNGQFIGTLPKGLLFVNNSSEYFDSKTNTYLPINSTIIGDSIIWNPSVFFGEYLMGNHAYPQNIVKIRFKVKSTCEYTSGSQIVFEMNGKAICGKTINRVKKVTSPLIIDNVVSTNSITLDGQISVIECANILNLSIVVEKSIPTTDNHLVINLPQGSTLLSEDSGLPIDLNPNQLIFYLDDNPFQSTINIVLKLTDTIGCGGDIISIVSTTKTNALCQESNQTCAIDVIDNTLNLPFSIEKPSLKATNFTIIKSDDSSVNVVYDLLNNSTIPAKNVSILFVLDRDNSGNLSVADTILSSISNSINAGTNTLSFDNLHLIDFQFCQLLLIISASENCICEDLIYPISDIEISTSITDICEGDTIVVGKDSIVNASYLWSSSSKIDCTTCSSSLITPEVSSEYLLTETYPNGCEVGYSYEVIPRDLPEIFTTLESICEGDTLFMYTSSNSAVWNVPDVISLGDGAYYSIPKQSQIYIAALTDTFGCMNADKIVVLVNKKPVVDIPDTTFCYGQNPSITNNSLELYDYLWIESAGFVNDPLSAEPSILVSQSHIFEVAISNQNCTILDTVKIEFYDGLNIEGVNDTLIVCFDQIYTLNLPVENTYIWTPDFNITCLNAECSEVEIDALMNETKLVIIGSSPLGCLDTISVSIVPSIEDILVNEEVYFCGGDTLQLNGLQIFEPIQICDTTNQDCKVITCTNYLLFQDIDSNYFEKTIRSGESTELSFNQIFSTYFWSNAETLSCNDCPNPIASPLETTIYTVNVTSPNGCEITLRYKVLVDPDCTEDIPLIPNAFTPNDNGENDIFRIANYPADAPNIITFKVFNEWGMELFDSKDNNGWDGTFSGQLATPATYVYIIEVGCGQNNSTVYKGGVTLIR